MLPAYQRFHRGDGIAGQIHFRLVVDDELIFEDGLAQAGFQRQLLHRRHLHAAAVELVIVAATAFGLVHRHVGLVDHRLGIHGGGRKQADADTGAQQQLVAVDQERLLHGVDDLLAQSADLRLPAAVVQHQGEFVAADPGQTFLSGAAVGDAVGGQLQQTVTDFMAERFVDGLEAVQIDHQQRHPGTIEAAQGERLVQSLAEQGAIGQAGKAVVVGEEADPLLRLLA